MDKNPKDFDKIDLEAPRLAQYMLKSWKKHQNTVYWVDINLACKKGLKFLQRRSNTIILYETLPAYSIPMAIMMEIGEIIYEKVFASLRPPPEIPWSLIGWKNWVQKLLDNQREKLLNNPKVSIKPTKIQTQIMIERRNPLFALKEEHPVLRNSKHVLFVKKLWNMKERETYCLPSRRSVPNTFSRDSTNFNVEDETKHDRTEKPVVCCGANLERSMLNEVDIDFRILGLPHSVAQQPDNCCVRELVKKIENHPHRQSL